jgi:hypothetical protein
MPDKELSNAIIAAADKDFSTFKDIIGDDLEQRFKDKIQQKTSTLAQQIFNPDFEPAEDDEVEDFEDEEFGDDFEDEDEEEFEDDEKD